MFGFKKEVINEEESKANKLKIIKEIKKKGEYFIHHAIKDCDSICFLLHRRFPYNTFGTQWNIGANYIGAFKTEAEARKAHKHILKKDINL